jgi:hypothetical protein
MIGALVLLLVVLLVLEPQWRRKRPDTAVEHVDLNALRLNEAAHLVPANAKIFGGLADGHSERFRLQRAFDGPPSRSGPRSFG